MGLWRRKLANGRYSWVYDFKYTSLDGIHHRPVKVLGVIPKTLANDLAKKFRLAKIEELNGFRPVAAKHIAVPLTVQAAVDVFLRDFTAGRRPGTVIRAAYSLQKLVTLYGSHTLAKLSLSDLEAMKGLEKTRLLYPKHRAKRAGVADATLDVDIGFWRQFFASAVDRGWIAHSPTAKLKGLRLDNERTRVLTPEEEERLWARLRPDMRQMSHFRLQTGLRPGEAYMLSWRQVDGRQRVLRLPPRSRKQRKAHIVPLNNVAREIIEQQRRTHGTSHDPAALVFPYADGRPWTYNRWRRRWARALREAELTDLRPHDLRHTFASRVLDAGYGIETVQELLGHSNISQTRRYVHIKQARLRAAVDALGQGTTLSTTRNGRSSELVDLLEKSEGRP